MGYLRHLIFNFKKNKTLILPFTVLRGWLSEQKCTVKKSDDPSKHQYTNSDSLSSRVFVGPSANVSVNSGALLGRATYTSTSMNLG